jgi:flagellar hook-length control protein FliK
MNAAAATPMVTAGPTPATASPAAAKAPPGSGAAADFALCLDQACDAAALPAEPAPTEATTPAEPLPAETTPAAASTTGAETAALDLSALLPGWAPAQTAAASGEALDAAAPTAAAAALAALDATPSSDTATAPTPPPRSAIASAALAAVAAGTSRSDAAHLAQQAEREARAAPATPAPPVDPAPRSDAHPKPIAPAAPQPAGPDLQTALPAPLPPPVGAPTVALTSATPAAAAALPSAAVPVTPGHPDFAPAVATQVRWWAHDGVQQAQLTLNPAEMGPVAVRIVIDGREARIDFSADVAATRQALEACLPVLAAALDESGLKLSGGGVHDGQAQRQEAWAAARAGQPAPRVAQGMDDAAAHARVEGRGAGGGARGLVDLVA